MGGDGEVTGLTTTQFMQFSIPDVGGIKNMVIVHLNIFEGAQKYHSDDIDE